MPNQSYVQLSYLHKPKCRILSSKLSGKEIKRVLRIRKHDQKGTRKICKYEEIRQMLFILRVSRMSDPTWEMWFFLSEIIQYPVVRFIFLKKGSTCVRHRAGSFQATQSAFFSSHLQQSTHPKSCHASLSPGKEENNRRGELETWHTLDSKCPKC